MWSKQQNDAEKVKQPDISIPISHPVTKEIGKLVSIRISSDSIQFQLDSNRIDISQFTIEEKCELVRNILLSEATTKRNFEAWIDNYWYNWTGHE